MPKFISGLPSSLSLRARAELRQGKIAHPWRITAVITADGDTTRVVINAMRDAGAALELTSTTYTVADYAAAIAKAQAMAKAHGCLAAQIIGAPALETPSLAAA